MIQLITEDDLRYIIEHHERLFSQLLLIESANQKCTRELR